ncbi:MAG: glucose 1-dehydrogenase [SAR202 cluster bacterium]|jgi:cyclopentanol dehydrogenase|nr:MAG: glucose 1-dehydrogenase [SAR202 cluster bacterium]MEC7733363.1 glucose 1-dehydrogenase [Chloroflexota bacterium]MED5409879.1 glucose 1-dehydrogenase [Chloroflexota bacterium]MED5450819.1 glucose 1-dehydrogenase [Chloroflexota bacterium]MEE3345768.1 glucose 1-dehydrogenase [Chloroflexota bacterium]|tara:strand:+ start:3610 stop:4359 length:750 start_codon:yes stop_codon:yes gene_type:complete
MGRLDGKVAIISGGAKGQGAEEARLFAQEGAKVIIGDILDREGMQIESEIAEQGGEAKFVHLDVSSEEDWSRTVDLSMSEYGRLDILVNNAGILLMKGLEETSGQEWDNIQNINSKGVFLGSKTVIPAMRESGGGSIVNISSIAGLIGSKFTAYGASKGLVRTLTKSVAVNHGHEGIRCNSVHPGIIETDMVSEMIGSQEGREYQLNRTPLKVIATSRDVALGVLYLASDESRYVTGSELVIDGGITAQ